MAKNIIFCADGTWNAPNEDQDQDGVPDPTNVCRLFTAIAGMVTPESLRRSDEQEKTMVADDGSVLQVAKYLHGIGDSSSAIKRVLGGVFGDGFIERIVRGYTYLSRSYEPGDRIHLVGFSRGAYTARALGGMVTSMGLLRPDDMKGADGQHDAELAYRLGTYVWSQYRRKAGKSSPLLSLLEEKRGLGIDLSRLVPGVTIKAIAVWDTVGALGIPIYDPDTQQPLDLFQFADTDLSPKVERGFHAVAIDERRDDFRPTLWGPRAGVTQRWFAGAHADVGGGYADTSFSQVPLAWMTQQLRDVGVYFLPDFRPAAAVWNDCHRPWTDPAFRLRPNSPRQVPADARFHRSVQERLDACATYQPDNLGAFLTGRTLRPDALD